MFALPLMPDNISGVFSDLIRNSKNIQHTLANEHRISYNS